jgi:glutamyl-tRNA reductase (EC 1.2.1.70)
MSNCLPVPFTIAVLSHHDADVAALEASRYPDERAFLERARQQFKGVVLLQTCNRVEILVQGEPRALIDFLAETGRDTFSVLENGEALCHLLELASGMDSLIVGEDQIIGQMKKAVLAAEEMGTLSPLLRICLDKAIHTGIQVRRKTAINRGAVSIGSAAVSLAEQLLGSLEKRHILVVGTGEMGMLVTKALAAKGLSAIYLANRTFERAAALAEKTGGKAVNLKELYHYITLSDVVISCTSAPHPIIHCEPLMKAMEGRKWPLEAHPQPLIVIDIAQPRDVEEGAEAIDGVRLYTVDNLREISENNIQARRKEMEQARELLKDELDHCIRLLKRASVDDILAGLYTWAEAIRLREKDRALHRMGTTDPRMESILDDLTHTLVKKLFSDTTFSIRSYAERGEIDQAHSLVQAITRGEAADSPPPPASFGFWKERSPLRDLIPYRIVIPQTGSTCPFLPRPGIQGTYRCPRSSTGSGESLTSPLARDTALGVPSQRFAGPMDRNEISATGERSSRIGETPNQ